MTEPIYLFVVQGGRMLHYLAVVNLRVNEVSQEGIDLSGEICSQPCGLLNLISYLSDKNLACAALSSLTPFPALTRSSPSRLSLGTQTRGHNRARPLSLNKSLPSSPESWLINLYPRMRVVLGPSQTDLIFIGFDWLALQTSRIPCRSTAI